MCFLIWDMNSSTVEKHFKIWFIIIIIIFFIIIIIISLWSETASSRMDKTPF